MSFRIENILKKEKAREPCEGGTEKCDSTGKDEPRLGQVEKDDSSSILHRTLSSRLQPPYYSRSLSENYATEKASPNFHTYGCDRLCYPQSYCNLYFDNDYQRLYARNKIYPMYTTSLPTIFPLQYSYYSKRKGGQVRFTANQTDVLEKRFLSHKYLSPEDRKTLADNLKLSDRQVKTWFQNRRAKWRRSTSSTSTENSTDSKDQMEILNAITSK